MSIITSWISNPNFRKLSLRFVKKLRINAGVGFQYLNGKLDQFEKNNSNGPTVNQITNIKFSELQILLR
jgi:hypothetical protein